MSRRRVVECDRIRFKCAQGTSAKIPRRHILKQGPQPLTGVSNAEGGGDREPEGEQAESIARFIEDQAFSPPYDLANFICFEINK